MTPVSSSLVSSLRSSASKAVSEWAQAWNTFWFTPRLPHTLAILRIITGAFLLYSHLVLASDLFAFLGDHAWVSNETAKQLHDGTFGVSDWGRSYLWYLHSPTAIWGHHVLTIVVTSCFAIGFLTRITAPAAWLLQLMYLHRLTGTLFGFDQIVTYSTMYLMLSPCGSLFSIDALLRKRFDPAKLNRRFYRLMFPPVQPSVSANVATRLMQIHLCLIYFFGGLAKARGATWWDGTAVWYSVGNFEYQSLDMTWLAHYPRVSSLLAHSTMFWEITYIFLIWPKLTRPWVLAIAVAMHSGIALFLGMLTFGTMMIAANLIFVAPQLWIRNHQESSENEPIENDEVLDDELDSELAALIEDGKVNEARLKLNRRLEKIKTRESKYRTRVAKLKKREAKIQGLVERAKKKNGREPQ